MQPNTAALIASFLLGVMVILWNMVLDRMPMSQIFLFLGCSYVLTAAVTRLFSEPFSPLSLSNAVLVSGFCVAYIASVIFCSVAFGHADVNMPIATAITAAYPVVTALFAVLFQSQRFTGYELLFFLMAVGGVVGMSLTSRSG